MTPPPSLWPRLSGDGLRFRSGPFTVRLRGGTPALAAQLRLLYPQLQPLDGDAGLPVDFHLQLRRPHSLRRWLRPQVRLFTDQELPYDPFPLDHALPLFEWGLNWCIAMQAHQYLMLHAAVVEKDGRALVMPALPGSGKSTLCAALMLRGWRLLSDEFGLVRPDDPQLALHPLPRPIPLKNASIEVIRRFSADAVLGPTFARTRKGDVAHLMASPDSQWRGDEPALPGQFLFVRYQAGAATQLEALPQGWTFLKVSTNSFNYRLQGAAGFRAVAALARRCPSHALTYSDLDQAVAAIEDLWREPASTAQG
jgi:HprK-related kinase A